MKSLNLESEIIDSSDIEKEMNENWNLNSALKSFDTV